MQCRNRNNLPPPKQIELETGEPGYDTIDNYAQGLENQYSKLSSKEQGLEDPYNKINSNERGLENPYNKINNNELNTENPYNTIKTVRYSTNEQMLKAHRNNETDTNDKLIRYLPGSTPSSELKNDKGEDNKNENRETYLDIDTAIGT